MRIDILTLFPQMCEAVMSESIIGRARSSGKVEINFHQIRDFAVNRHNQVDDTPYGGGAGMLMMPQPIYDCFMNVCSQTEERPHLIYMSPCGKTLTQERVKELSKLSNIAILCGRYEGVDQRVIDEIVDEEISIGDYVLTGGELPAMVLVDTVSRYVEGVLANHSTDEETFSNGILEYPQYTRPEVFLDKKVPEVLLSGHHENIRKWRRKEALRNTYRKRKELLDNAELSKEDDKYLKEIIEEGGL